MRFICSLLLSAIFVLSQHLCVAQELNCMVELNTQKVQGQESVMESLREAINEYMNSTKFTPYQISANEKIDCRLYLTVNGYANDVVFGELQVQSTRPVYDSSYNSTLLNLRDENIRFEYKANDRLVFSETNIESSLTGLLDFYAYLILAVDFDSFSLRGGQYCFDKLQNIVLLSQSSADPGWKMYTDNGNRAAVLAAFTEPNTQALRVLIYKYHMEGLDKMALVPEKGRAAITESLSALESIREKSPMSIALTLWHDAKLDEMINIYSKGSQRERDGVYDILVNLYPTDQSRMQNIKTISETY